MTGFLEKPPIPPDATGTRLASMGLYIFRSGVLTQAITADAERRGSKHDFGGDILPSLVDTGRLMAYDFSTNEIPGMGEDERGYWRDIGTIDAYWDASQDLVSVQPRFSLYNQAWPIYSAYYPSPPSKFVFSDREQNRVGIATDSLVSEGCIISGGHVNRSILGPRVRVNSYSAVGCLGAILVTWAHNRLTFKVLKDSAFRTLENASMVMLLLVAANFVGGVFSACGTPKLIANYLLSLNLPAGVFVIGTLVVCFILGWPLEWVPIVAIILPIFVPILTTLRVDMIWFCILVAVTLQSCWISPPVAASAGYSGGARSADFPIWALFGRSLLMFIGQIFVIPAPWTATGL